MGLAAAAAEATRVIAVVLCSCARQSPHLSVRVRCFSTASSIVTINGVCAPGWEGGNYHPELGKQSWCE